MKIVISGGTGLIGRRTAAYFAAKNWDVLVISRSDRKPESGIRYITWDESEQNIDKLENCDAIIHLAGETINQRWTPKAKAAILDSRIQSTRRIAKLVDRLQKKPRAVLSGSAIGYYGSSPDGTFDEESSPEGRDFLTGVVEKWEAESKKIRGTRVVQLRTGVVLDAHGGALPKMLLPYKLGVGGRLGHGKQWLSWIHIDDMVRIIEHCLLDEGISGPVNCTAPLPVTNDEFGKTIAKVMHRAHWFPVPAAVFKLLFGEMSDLLLEGQRVLPKKSLQHGFIYRFPSLYDALRDLLESK